MMTIISIEGRRWFQSSYGNTYHSVEIYVDGDLVHTIPRSYGYGEMYLQNAQEWLIENGYVKGRDTTHLRLACEDQGIKLRYHVQDVPRRKDLQS